MPRISATSHRFSAARGLSGRAPQAEEPEGDTASRRHISRTGTRPTCARRAWHLSRVSRARSSSWGLRRPLPGKAATGSPATSGVQRRNRFGVIPRSRAVCAVGWPPAVTNFTASCLNSRRLCPLLTTSWVSRPHPFRGLHYFGGGSSR
jgi:hypothetical protein